MASNFPFVSDLVLRENLDIAFNHILDLIPFSESKSYSDLAKSSFRKTVIIYTASIIEALLLYLLEKKYTKEDLVIYKWDFTNKIVLHEVTDSHQIIAGDYMKNPEKIKFEKLNLGNINNFLKAKDYTKADLEFVFSVAKEVKKLFT